MVQMATRYYQPRTCDEDSDDESRERVNDRLLDLLLKLTPATINDVCSTQSLPSTISDNDSETQLELNSVRRFPPPPSHPDNYEHNATSKKTHFLPPIGVFWDIENCQVPKGRSAIAVTQTIRDKFFGGYKEAEFIVVCDVQKENKQIVQELNDAQVNLIHVAATCKNAADEKLRQSIRRFADIHGSPAAVILISGDINFAADLCDLRHRKKIHVILLHKENTSEALILCANEHYDFTQLTESLPSRTPAKVTESYDLLVCNLPEDKDILGIKRRLKQLSNNCGGRVIEVQSNAAIVRFFSKESADRAQKRMHGEYVFNSKITVQYAEEKDNFNEENRGLIIRKHTSSESEVVIESPRQMYNSGTSVGARSLPVTPHYHPASPGVDPHSNWIGMHCAPSGIVQPVASYMNRNFANGEGRSFQDKPRIPTPMMDRPRNVGMNRRVFAPQVREIAENLNGRPPEMRQRPRGQFNNFNQPCEWNAPRLGWPHAGPPNPYGPGYPQNFKRRSPSPMFMNQNHEPNHWNGQQHPMMRSRTPSPYEFQTIGQNQHRMSPYNDTESEENDNFFNPINRNGSGQNNGSYSPIELQVTNLDQNIDPKDMKRILHSIFMEHVMVLHVSVFVQSDGNYAASVKVPSLPEAQYAISQLHRRKIGYKRILISYAHAGGPSPQIVRSQIVMLLQEVPGHKLPLFKFREMYESRFMISISVSELYKLKDVCVITDDPSGRMVSLSPDHRNTPSPCFLNASQDGHALELPYCTIHTQRPWSEKGWAEQEMSSLPNVRISLKLLAIRTQQLLASHNRHLPLASFPNCYEAEFKEPLHIDENGVPLEHLVSCLSSVELKQGIGSVKYLVWAGDKSHSETHEENKCVSPPLANQLALFSRELVDLLKTAPHCQLLFNRFIPAYHHHFGRQCRVADYGFTKLIDLLEALTHTVQVMGEGNKRVVTLSHRAQIRRFTSDLLRVLKAQASKQVTLSEFPNVYPRVIGKSWDVVDYGVCDIEDMLSEVSENTVVVTTHNDNDKMIAIPKREQTPEEIARTKQFAVEVIELLRHAPQNQMLFNKFVPSYHHHFGHQCRVSDYGFTKLIELFEAIPEVVKIEDTADGERRISLTEKEGARVLGEQISKLVTRNKGSLSVSNVAHHFLQQFGYALRPELFKCNSILQLLEKLHQFVRVVPSGAGAVVVTVDKTYLQQLGLQCRRILMDKPHNRMPVVEFKKVFTRYYNRECSLEEIQKELPTIVQFLAINDETCIELTPLQRFACHLYQVLMNYGGSLNLSQFESAYLNVIGSACRAAQFGFPTLQALLQALPCTVILKETRSKKKVLHLNKKLASVGFALPHGLVSSLESHRETDSSNESVESDSSLMRLSQANMSTIGEQRQWQQVWKRQDTNEWYKKDENAWRESAPDVHWLNMSRGDFKKEWMRTPTVQKGTYLPTNSQSPDEIALDEDDWKSSIWSPPKYTYSGSSTLVEVPPMSQSSWDQIVNHPNTSNLLSPTKNLLPASANPYFSAGLESVVAPHPSELPLPSMSLTPKKNVDPNVSADSAINNSINDGRSSCSNVTDRDSDCVDGLDITPSKRTFARRRLAAQFNQPIDS